MTIETWVRIGGCWTYRKNDDQVVCIGAHLHPCDKSQLVHLMEQYKENFDWLPTNMLGIDINITCNKLSIDPSVKLV